MAKYTGLYSDCDNSTYSPVPLFLHHLLKNFPTTRGTRGNKTANVHDMMMAPRITAAISNEIPMTVFLDKPEMKCK